jgi:hypothetical protein
MRNHALILMSVALEPMHVATSAKIPKDHMSALVDQAIT